MLENISDFIRTELRQNALIRSVNEKIRERPDWQGEKPVDVSVGSAAFKKNIRLEERLKIADQKMYEDKQSQNGTRIRGTVRNRSVQETWESERAFDPNGRKDFPF